MYFGQPEARMRDTGPRMRQETGGVEGHFAVDHNVPVAFGPLDTPPFIGWQVMHDFTFNRIDRVVIVDHNISRHTRTQGAAILDASRPGRHTAQTEMGFFQRQRIGLTDEP